MHLVRASICNRVCHLRNYCNHVSDLMGERALTYLAESPERKQLEKELDDFTTTTTEVPIVIGKEEMMIGEPQNQIIPFDHNLIVAKFYNADESTIKKAFEVSINSRKQWERTDWKDRMKVFERAAELISGPYRQKLNAATMLGQAKTTMQAELDSACMLTDFIRLNCASLEELSNTTKSSAANWEQLLRYKSMEGFWTAITSFHSTAIAGNLATAPILMGNVGIWKPSKNAILSNWLVFQVFREAGLPPGVLNFTPSTGQKFVFTITNSNYLCGVNFSGSRKVFNGISFQVGSNIDKYLHYPRLIGELHGNNSHFVHYSADAKNVINYTIRAAFEYTGQKSTACSRLYLPESLKDVIINGLVEAAETISVCHSVKFNAFMSSVINKDAFSRIKKIIDYANSSLELKILTGGCSDDTIGCYIEPTIILCNELGNKIMKEEIFGPILLVYVYKDSGIEEMYKILEDESIYARSGAVFAKDEKFLRHVLDNLPMENIYINDSSTSGLIINRPNRLRQYSHMQSMKHNVTNLDDFKFPYMNCKPCIEKIDIM